MKEGDWSKKLFKISFEAKWKKVGKKLGDAHSLDRFKKEIGNTIK